MKKKHIRIAVIGAKRSGKTVLLTAIDNALRWLGSKSFTQEDKKKKSEFLNDWKFVKYEPGQTVDHRDKFNWEPFPVQEYRTCCFRPGSGEWPPSTIEPTRLIYNIGLTNEVKLGIFSKPIHKLRHGWGKAPEKQTVRRDLTVEFLDIPGERVADILTMQDASFEEWSDVVWKDNMASNSIAVGKAFGVYQNLCIEHRRKLVDGEGVKPVDDAGKADGEGVDPVDDASKAICEAYKQFVATQYKHHYPFITPSVMLMDSCGRQIDIGGEKDVEKIAKGLNDVDFAPLPAKFFVETSEGVRSLVEKFTKAYQNCRKRTKVEELVKWFACVDQVYYLVDVLTMLQCKEDCRLESVIRQIRHVFPMREEGRLRCLWNTVRRNAVRRREISRVCAVATQIDRTNVTRDQANIEELMKLLFGDIYLGERFGPPEILSCSAVRSTSDVNEGEKKEDWGVKGVLLSDYRKGVDDEGNVKKECKPVSVVPDGFDFGKDVHYEWPYPQPCFCGEGEDGRPRLQNHVGLDELLQRMLGCEKGANHVGLGKLLQWMPGCERLEGGV